MSNICMNKFNEYDPSSGENCKSVKVFDQKV